MTDVSVPPASPLKLTTEEIADLRRFADIVLRWNPRINLVSKSSAAEIWDRHILDSAQIFDLAPQSAESWIDLGSGGGFPGIVVAVIATRRRPALTVALVESDQRKAVFLRQATRELGLKATVLSQRIEKIADLRADVVSARALAALPELLALASPLLADGGTCLFAKGASRQQELDAARQSWSFNVTEVPSITDPGAAILRITEVHHV
ncbi:16S rRNA (guanine(527)-N(7))-methyltransferase RsmG [Paracoccaceae bacterium]